MSVMRAVVVVTRAVWVMIGALVEVMRAGVVMMRAVGRCECRR